MHLHSSDLATREGQEHHAPELERQLLRHGVMEMAAHRSACSQCRRSPLVGERLRVFASAGEERWICDLCLAECSEQSLGEFLRSERVRASERRLHVRRAA